MNNQSPVDFMREYERRTNTHDPEQVAELIVEDAVYWFNNGSFIGREAITAALLKTWNTIQDEHYGIENVQWLAVGESIAVCIYTFRWRGKINGKEAEGVGRGTSVLKKIDNVWKVVHEHLSGMPD